VRQTATDYLREQSLRAEITKTMATTAYLLVKFMIQETVKQTSAVHFDWKVETEGQEQFPETGSVCHFSL